MNVIATETAQEFLIREGGEDDARFFFEVEEQTTLENLPRDGCVHGECIGAGCAFERALDRARLREALCATHRMLLEIPGHVFFIAQSAEGERAGLLWFGPKRNLISGEDEGWVYNVTVLLPFRGRGLGKRLLHHAEEYARSLGYGAVGLSVATHNVIARTLYESVGFAPSNIVMRKPLARSSENGCVLCENDVDAA
jgi:ribosomal protein S18 acetylase RimI-like enzyme